jgi:hypothetical protein
MTLTERYLKAVAAQLPKAQRDDIIAELADAIADRMEAREEELGRPLTEDEQEAVLREVGHPLAVAARYGSGPQHVVGPELYPWWIFGLKVGIGAVVVLTLIGLAARVLGGDILAGEAIGRAFTDVFSSAVTLIGFATIAAFIIERQKEKPAFLREWKVKDLGVFEWASFDTENLGRRVSGGAAAARPVKPQKGWSSGQMSPMARAVASAVCWTVFLLWWTGLLPNVPTNIEIVDGVVDGIDYGALTAMTFGLIYWPVTAYAVARILFGLFRAWRPDAIRLAGLFDMGLGLARMWACVWLWTASPFAARISVASFDEFTDRVQPLFHGDGTLANLLMMIVTIAFVVAAWETVAAFTRVVGGRAALKPEPKAA